MSTAQEAGEKDACAVNESNVEPEDAAKKKKTKRDIRPKVTLTETLLSVVPETENKLPEATVFEETYKYVKKCVPDASKFGRWSSTTKNGKRVFTFTISGDVDKASMEEAK